MIVLLTFLLITVISLPARDFKHTPSSDPNSNGFVDFSKPETFTDGSSYTSALAEPSIIYPRVPRYTVLNLKLKLNLTRPAGLPPAHLEIYENVADPLG